MPKTERGIGAARRATALVCDVAGEHKGQGLLVRLDGCERAMVLTCHHVVALVSREDLRVRLPLQDGRLGEPVAVVYDEGRSRPEQDAAVLLVDETADHTELVNPLLHQLGTDTYEGTLGALVLTHLTPQTFDATVRPSTALYVSPPAGISWPDAPECYQLQEVFRLSVATDSRPGISGGVVLCEGGILGLAHFGRAESKTRAREAYLVPLSIWAEGWPALEAMIEPLVDKELEGAAVVKRAEYLEAGVGKDVTVAGYRPEVYAKRETDKRARRATVEHGGVMVVGRPQSGKTRLVLELLQEEPRTVVVIPKPDHSGPPGGFEASGFRDLDIAIMFDDLHRTAETSQTLAWRRTFEEASGRPCKLVCMARDGEDWRRVEEGQQRLLEALGKEEATVFTSRVGRLGRQRGEDLTDEQGRDLAEELGMSEAEFRRRFDGTPGSLLLDLNAMRMRYKRLRDECRGGVPMSRLLDSVKLLYRAYQPAISHELVRAVAERVRGSARLDEETWEAALRRASEEGFAQLYEETGDIRYYAPYLEACVEYEPARRDFAALQPLLEETENVVGLFSLVGVYGQVLNDYERALSCAERALELDPNLAPAWYNKSYALNHLGRNEEALVAIERALDLDPEYAASWYSKGMALNHLGRHKEALEAHETAVRLGSRGHPAALSMFLYGLGGTLVVLGHLYEALSAGVRSLELYPPYASSLNLLLGVVAAAGVPEYALKIFERLLQEDPARAKVWCAKGHALGDMGRRTEALASYEEALQLDPRLAEGWAGKGGLLLEMSDGARGSRELVRALTSEGVEESALDLARRSLGALERSIELGSNTPDSRGNRALALSRLGRTDEALRALKDGLESVPDSSQLLHNRGILSAKVGRCDKALQDFVQATSIDPSYGPSWWQIVVLMSGHFDQQIEALHAVDHLITLWPGDAGSWFAKGCILTKLGRSEEGRFWLRCARSHEALRRWLLAGYPDGKQRSFFEFAGPEEPGADDRYRAIGSPSEDPMRAMAGRFKNALSSEQRDVLRAIKLLAFAGIGDLSHRRLRAVLESDRLFDRKDRLSDALQTLAGQAFLDLPAEQDPVSPEFACLWESVKYREDSRIEQDLEKLEDLFYAELADHEGLSILSVTFATRLGQPARAVSCADRAIAVKADYPPAWTNKSSALGSLGRHTEALEAAEQAERLAPGRPEPLVNKGSALYHTGRPAEALAVFDDLVESLPNNTDVLVNRGATLVELGRSDEGMQEFVRAGSLDPGDADLALREGWALAANEDFEGALRAVDRALGVRPHEHWAFFLKGTVLAGLEREEEAVTWYLRAWTVRERFPDGGAMIVEMLSEFGHDLEQETP